ncbi:MAG: rod shape-determining protein MreC [Planctomycetota bacterium]|jgi:cell shape-determining protein MreC
MILKSTSLRTRLRPPAVSLAIGVLVSAVLALLPGRWTGSIRGAAATLLRPGQIAASGLRRHGTRATTRIKVHFQTAARLAEAEDELQGLRRDNRRLAAELAAAQSRPPGPAGNPGDDEGRLLRTRCVPARVLGRQARAFLGRHHLLDVGTRAGIEPDALVVDCPRLIDRGRDAEIEPGQLLVAGRRVWGKVVEVGRNTSVVRGVTEPGYRDLVQLGDPPGPQAMLEGTGEPLPRVRLVEVTEPVSIGDAVYTATGKGVLPVPLLCGRIVRLERPVGAAYWDIWMQPAVAEEPERVAVLRTELNPLRVAEKEPGARGQESGVRE